MEDIEENPRIIIDSGTSTIKFGKSYSDYPHKITPISWKLNEPHPLYRRKTYFGDSNLPRISYLAKISHIIENSKIKNWDKMSELWNHCITQELYSYPEDHSYVLSQAPETSKNEMERIAAIFFEEFYSKSLLLKLQGALALYSSGRTTGISFESGEGQAHLTPVYEGFPIKSNLQILKEFSGNEFTENLKNLLDCKIFGFNSQKEKTDFTKIIKERVCYISEDYINEFDCFEKRKLGYFLPDGEEIEISGEIIQCPERFFNPFSQTTNYGRYSTNKRIHQEIIKTVRNCDSELSKSLYGNIVISGGNCRFTGLKERLEKEVENLMNSREGKATVIDQSKGEAVWTGGRIVSGIESFLGDSVSIGEYSEIGENIVHRKWF